MARTRIVGDPVLRVNDLGQPVPGVVSAATGIPSSTGCTVSALDPRAPANRSRVSSVQNADGATPDTWDFVAWSGLKLSRDATASSAISGTSNKPCGKFILTSGSSSYTLANTFIAATSIVVATCETAGILVPFKQITLSAGHAIFTFTSTVGANTTVSWVVFNGN